MEASVLEGGFGDAAVEAARAFRMAMRVMARPGTVEVLDAATPPAPVSVAAGTLLLTLCDHETGVYLAGAYDTGELREWLAFHTGAPVVAAESAQFALGDWAALMPLSQYAVGTPEYPDRSATLIVEMARLEARGTGLRGPGIKERAELSLPEPQVMTANAAQFPLGVDFFLTCGDRVAGLPRSTKLEDGACT